jgi:predicted kinase
VSETPLHPDAAAALGPARTRTLAGLAAALAGQTGWVVEGLVAAIGVTGADEQVPIAWAALLDAARREAEIRGDNYVRCEYLLLGAVRVLGDGARLERARADFQVLMGDRALGRYLRLEPRPRRPGNIPKAIVVAGLPGTGKSTLAEALGRELRAPVFSMDWELGVLVPFGAVRPDNLGPMPELMMAASMARQLQLGLDVILDATTLRAAERQRLRALAEALDAMFVGVECQCSDQAAHRSRLDGRSRGIPGWPATVSWDHVQRMRERWEPWAEPHLVVDTAVESPDAALDRILRAVRSGTCT